MRTGNQACKRAVRVAWVLAAVFVGPTGRAAHGGGSSEDVPHGVMGVLTEKNWITVQCRLLPGAMSQRATCHFEQVLIVEPDPLKVESQAREAKAILDTPDGEKVMRALCDEFSRNSSRESHLTTYERRLVPAMGKACAARDRVEFRKVFVEVVAGNADACSVSMSASDEVFKRLDVNTWTHTVTGGICNTTSTGTLWRENAKKDWFWNYREIHVTPPNASGPFCKTSAGKTEVLEYSWQALGNRDIGCRAIKLF